MIDIENAYFENVFYGVSLKSNARKIGIIGRNGIGKSTFLMQFMKINTKADKFEIFNQNMLENGKIDDFSIVFQESKSSLYPLFDIGRYILFLAKDKKISNVKLKTLELCEKFRLKDVWHSYPHELSIGESKKICLIIALLKSPKLLILDEINAGIDKQSLNVIYDFLDSCDLNIVLTSHDKDFLGFCDENYEFFKDGLKCF